MRFATMAAAVTLAVSGLTVWSSGPAAAGGYCRTTVDHVPVHAEPRLESAVVRDIPVAGTFIMCGSSSNPAWWQASDERDGRRMGFVEVRLTQTDCC